MCDFIITASYTYIHTHISICSVLYIHVKSCTCWCLPLSFSDLTHVHLVIHELVNGQLQLKEQLVAMTPNSQSYM